jgi:hypothetical protein
MQNGENISNGRFRNERNETKNVLKEEKLDDIGGHWKEGPDNYSRISPCCRSGRKQPALLFEVSKTCAFLDPELGFFLGRIMVDVINWNKIGVRTTAIVILGITSVGGRCTVIGKSEGPCFFEETINLYGRGRLVLTLMFNDLTA